VRQNAFTWPLGQRHVECGVPATKVEIAVSTTSSESALRFKYRMPAL
jgi:hypothetical protein